MKVLLLSLAIPGFGVASSVYRVPDWTSTYNLSESTLIMPCNETGFTDPNLAAQFGIVDFDWSNAKVVWANQNPMDCEERLVLQTEMVKKINPNAKTFVYRNLVKALPWYTSVREKIVDPAYSGWFLKFKEGGSLPDGKWHVPACTTDAGGTKCSEFYHDQEQTPKVNSNAPTRSQVGDWFIYNNTNDVSGLRPGWKTITDGGRHATAEGCRAAADAAKRKMFTWWPTDDLTSGYCWFTSDWHTASVPGAPNATRPGPEAAHVSGYKPDNSSDIPPPALTAAALCISGECHCGEGLPCGEYLWDHRNESLRSWLVNEFILGKETGLGNVNVDGFFFDDGWTDKPSPIPPWAPPTYRQCDMSPIGGATEEDFYCTVDMGLTAQDTTDITSNHTVTMNAVTDAVLAHKGFIWQEFNDRAASIDLADPRPSCSTFMRQQCVANSSTATSALLFEFTRKLFHDPFPLPFVEQDIAMFSLIRGPFAWIGHSWMGCNTGDVTREDLRPPQVEVDYGVPVDDHCTETSPNSGIFNREWSKASIQLDCNTWTAKTTPK